MVARCVSHPWFHVVTGMWKKYPNPKCSHVISIDVLDRSVDPNTGIIRTERVLGCKQKAPGWIVKVSRQVVRSGLYLLNVLSAIWWFRGCICARNHLRGPSHPECDNHFSKPLPVAIRNVLWAHTVHTINSGYNIIYTDGRDTGSNGTLAVGCGQPRKVVGATFWTECSTREIGIYGCTANTMGRKARTVCRIRWCSANRPPVSYAHSLHTRHIAPLAHLLYIDIYFVRGRGST